MLILKAIGLSWSETKRRAQDRASCRRNVDALCPTLGRERERDANFSYLLNSLGKRVSVYCLEFNRFAKVKVGKVVLFY